VPAQQRAAGGGDRQEHWGQPVGDRRRAWGCTVGGKTESPRSERVTEFAHGKVASKSESNLIYFQFPN
jgi:hypothetical protein